MKIYDLLPLVGLMLFHTIVHGLSSSGAVNTYVTACTPLTWQLCLSGLLLSSTSLCCVLLLHVFVLDLKYG